jgi:CheY-like chemotaxis protein
MRNIKILLVEDHSLKPDLIISNVGLPDVSGLDFYGRIEDFLEKERIAFMFFTSQNTENMRRQAMTLGADDFVGKDESINYLMIRIGRIVKRLKYMGAANTKRLLKVFISYAREDAEIAKEIWDLLNHYGVVPWLDKENILPGKDWEMEIKKAINSADVVLTCLSNNSVSKKGFVQKELRFALDVLGLEPEGSVFVIPIRLDDCSIPDSIKMLHCLDYCASNRTERLLSSLSEKAKAVNAMPPSGSITDSE